MNGVLIEDGCKPLFLQLEAKQDNENRSTCSSTYSATDSLSDSETSNVDNPLPKKKQKDNYGCIAGMSCPETADKPTFQNEKVFLIGEFDKVKRDNQKVFRP